MGRQDAESETLIPTIGGGFDDVAHTLRADGFDASEDGTGRGTPLVPVAEPYTLAIRGRGDESVLEYRQDGTANALLTPSGGRGGINVGAIAFGCKDSDPARGIGEDVAPTLRAMQHDGSHANAGGQVAVAIRMAQTGANGIGVDDGGAAYTLDGAQQAVAFAHQGGGVQTTLGYDPKAGTAPTLSVGQTPAIHIIGGDNVPAEKLRALRQAVPAADFEKWGFGIAQSVGAQEVLRSLLHGGGVRRQAIEGQELDDRALPRSEVGAEGAVQRLWEAGCNGRASSGWQPPEQLARELGAYLPLMPQQGAQAARFLFGLWKASEGLGVLRQALSAVQEVGRPAGDQAQPARAFAVRRLTPREAERLQGAEDDWTLVPNDKGKPMADGPRYKMLGNSFAVPVIQWIGRQIERAHHRAMEAA